MTKCRRTKAPACTGPADSWLSLLEARIVERWTSGQTLAGEALRGEAARGAAPPGGVDKLAARPLVSARRAEAAVRGCEQLQLDDAAGRPGIGVRYRACGEHVARVRVIDAARKLRGLEFRTGARQLALRDRHSPGSGRDSGQRLARAAGPAAPS